MIETLKTKLKAKAVGTDKKFLIELISVAETSILNLAKVNHPRNTMKDLSDLKANLENVIVHSAVIVLTDENGTCELKDDEIKQLIQ